MKHNHVLGEVMKCYFVKIIPFFCLFFVVQSCAMEPKAESKEVVVHKRLRFRAKAMISVQDLIQPSLDEGNYKGALESLSDAARSRRYDDCVTILVYLIQKHFFIEPTMQVVRNTATARHAEKTRLMLSLKYKDNPKTLAKIPITSDRSVGQVRSRLIKILQKTNNQINETLSLKNQ